MNFEKVIRDPSERGLVSRYREIKNQTAEVVGVRVVRKHSTAKAHAAIRDMIVANPNLSYQKIADLMGCSRWLIYRVAVEFDVRRTRGPRAPARQAEAAKSMKERTSNDGREPSPEAIADTAPKAGQKGRWRRPSFAS